MNKNETPAADQGYRDDAPFECGVIIVLEPTGNVRVNNLRSPAARRAPTESEFNTLIHKAQYGLVVQDAVSAINNTIVSLVEQSVGQVLAEAVTAAVDSALEARLGKTEEKVDIDQEG